MPDWPTNARRRTAADSREVPQALQAIANLCRISRQTYRDRLGLADCEVDLRAICESEPIARQFGRVGPAVAVKLGVRPMSWNVPEVAILLADVTGSTPLYEAIGDAAAARQIVACRDGLQSIITRRGGTFIQSRGDDVLCTFAEPSSALRAAREMLAQSSAGSVWRSMAACMSGLSSTPMAISSATRST